MKDFRGMKRQRSRNRKSSGNQNNPNRAYESNGPEGTKVRGNAQTVYEKYQQLARDANSSGDRVLAENHLQHAEHYFRLIRMMQPQRPVSEFVQRDPFASAFDDFDDDIETPEAVESEGEATVPGEGDQPAFDEARENGRDRQRFDRDNRRDRDRNRDRNRERQPYDNREQRTFEPRNGERNGEDGERQNSEFEGGRRESRRERYERRRQQRLADQEQNLSSQPNGNGSAAYVASTEPLGGSRAPAPLAPEATPSDQPEIRDDHLPAFLRQPVPVSPAPAAEGVEAPAAEEPAKPKRGRPKRKAEAATEEA